MSVYNFFIAGEILSSNSASKTIEKVFFSDTDILNTMLVISLCFQNNPIHILKCLLI